MTYVLLVKNYRELNKEILIVYGFFGEGTQILINRKLGNSALSLLIGLRMDPFPENTELYDCLINMIVNVQCNCEGQQLHKLHTEDSLETIDSSNLRSRGRSL